MVKIFIDEKQLEAAEGTTILKAAKKAGIDIPHLCYHSSLPTEGSCRMCLVEIEGLPKLELACSTQVREDMKVFTHSEKVIEARKGVLEFLLAEHPIDCPICDKAGECKLQDYYDEHGMFENQFDETKEKREKKVPIGKKVLLDQERCILCTRCVRFLREVTKTQELGVFERGNYSEVNLYEGALVDNNYAGNLAEICPVGAITDADFRFQTRSWFLSQGESICPLCSRGCNISIEYHPGFLHFPVPKRVYRIKARENLDINDRWICDIGRYGYSYINEDRLDKIISNHQGYSKDLKWDNISFLLAKRLMKLFHMHRISWVALLLNTWLTNEELFLLKKIFVEDLGVKKIFVLDPPEEEGDTFLLTPERSPNRRGVQEMGFSIESIDTEAFVKDTELLLAFSPARPSKWPGTEMKSILDQIETKVLFTSHQSELCQDFDLVLPLALIAEEGGSLTNLEGKTQSFTKALDPPGDSRSGWEILVDLAKELKLNFNNHKPFISPETIREAMKKEISFFRKNK